MHVWMNRLLPPDTRKDWEEFQYHRILPLFLHPYLSSLRCFLLFFSFFFLFFLHFVGFNSSLSPGDSLFSLYLLVSGTKPFIRRFLLSDDVQTEILSSWYGACTRLEYTSRAVSPAAKTCARQRYEKS